MIEIDENQTPEERLATEMEEAIHDPSINCCLSIAESTLLLQGIQLLHPFMLEKATGILLSNEFTEEQKKETAYFVTKSLAVLENVEKKIRDGSQAVADSTLKLLQSAHEEIPEERAAASKAIANQFLV